MKTKFFTIATTAVILLMFYSCSSPQSKWTKEQVEENLIGTFNNANDKYGGYYTVEFNKDMTWIARYINEYGAEVNAKHKSGTWSIGNYNKQYNHWDINTGTEGGCTLSTNEKGEIYFDGNSVTYVNAAKYK